MIRICDEYLTAKEIEQKIADLKIRLALQQEFERELAQLDPDAIDAVQLQCLKSVEEKSLACMTAHAGTQRHDSKHSCIMRRTVCVAAAIILLAASCIGSAMATVHMVQTGLLKLDVRSYSQRTSYELALGDDTVDVPAEWSGDFYPTYIPDGFEFDSCYYCTVCYTDSNGKAMSFSEETYGSQTNLDTENAVISSVDVNGTEATLIEKEGWTAIVWADSNRLFVVEMDGSKDEVINVAASVTMIK